MIERVLSIAQSQLGVRERGGNNRGPQVEQYQAAAGIGPGDPWCAAFDFWVLERAGVKGWPKSGYCPYIETWAKERKILHEQPQRGDVFLLYDAQGPFHTGIVTGVLAGGRVATIEGNTGGEGPNANADGDGVYPRTRPVNACKFVRWAELLGNRVPALSVVLAGKAIPCSPRVENGKTRVELRPVVEALGWHLKTSDMFTNGCIEVIEP